MSLITATTPDMLNLEPGIGQRQATFRFELFSGRTGEELGVVHPNRNSPPTVAFETGRTIKRTLQGVQFDPEESELIDALSGRLRVFMEIGGDDFPLGEFVFVDSMRVRRSGRGPNLGWSQGERWEEVSLVDYGFIIDQPRTKTFAVPTGQNIGAAAIRLLDDIGVTNRYIDGTTAVAGSPMVWGAGTSGAKILQDLADHGGYLSPFFQNDGFLRLRLIFDPAKVAPTIDLDTPAERIVADSIGETDDLLEAANRFIVIDNSNTDAPIVGVYDVPTTAPFSAFNRGFVVAKVEDRQGMASAGQADTTAMTVGLQQTLFERVELSTPPDPRHDGYEVVRYDDRNWLETGWSLPCREGAPMRHSLSRAYTDLDLA